MNKKFGLFLILGILVLSMSFSSANWFSDVWNKITGNSITGEVVNNVNDEGDFPNAVPLYRYYSSVSNDHFYTIRGGQYDTYKFEGIEGYVYSTQVEGTVPLYRLWFAYGEEGDHYYTTSVEEKNNATRLGYRDEGIECYIYPVSNSKTVPLYELYTNGDHFYTTSENEKNLLVADDINWDFGGIRGYVLQKCATLCVSRGSGVSTPSVSAFSIVNPNREQTISVSGGGSGTFGYEFWWSYNFVDGSILEICSCNISASGVETLEGIRVYSGNLAGGSYSFPFNLTNTYGKTISGITLKVATRRENNISEWKSETRQVVYPNCPVSPICDTLGKNTSVNGKNNFYRTCVEHSSGCYNWSEERMCSTGFVYDVESGKCISGSAFSCRGTATNGNPIFCAEGLSVPFGAYNYTGGSCGNNHQTCVVCNTSRTWDASQKECTINGCLNNCTGVCSGVSVGNASMNTNFTCCSSKSCYVCNEGYHPNNGSCVSDICSGVKPAENSPNVSFGVNSTNISSVNMVWNYVRGVAGACQWNCSVDYKINISNNLSCMYGRVNCSELNGICSTTALSNAKVDSGADCVSGSCYVCNEENRYFSDGKTCVLSNNCASGYVWNGFVCSPYVVQCASNCTLNGRCIVSEPNRIVRANINVSGKIIKAYCDPSSKVFVALLADNQSCSYNAQCASNLCGADLRCLNIAKEVRDASGLFRKVYCWFTNGFSYTSAQYNACLATQ